MEDLIALGQKYVMNTYRRLPVVLVRGSGAYVWDSEGNKYLDFVSGIAVNSLGHCPQVVTEAIKEQAEKLIHCSNLYWIEPQIKLAQKLVESSCCHKAFFCNSGTEANEAAVKLARKWGKGRFEIITMEKSFHGRTLGSLAATGQEKYQKDFRPLPAGFKYVPFNDLKALEDAVTFQTCAVMLECIQGEGGVNVPDPGYLQGVQEICRKNNLLLIVDEVQTGLGRTGKAFAYQHFNISPDIITLAKALGSGVPIGAMLAKEEVAEAFQPGDHAATFGGNPLATQAALAATSVLLDEKFLAEVAEKGQYFKAELAKLKEDFSQITKVKGLGLMVGCELSIDALPIVEFCMKHKVLINAVGGNILRFVPPLIVTKSEIDQVINTLKEALLQNHK
ncbi:acetylornithine transaminase [Tepidanaerobacter sp. GT38]|uniref:acetylornithine transaminase n=1 Tax=Tepidanaerobacter sp. GT38 TaxID=2722793 RepID=UPI001F024059|nr:acetylornithine transaminase [Tepidanaerobacter sp. GT38]MCG1013131.1 acetylornithine transaminase [Tepidanaerobacter sp. GT38]